MTAPSAPVEGTDAPTPFKQIGPSITPRAKRSGRPARGWRSADLHLIDRHRANRLCFGAHRSKLGWTTWCEPQLPPIPHFRLPWTGPLVTAISASLR
jgi:hypothetical protein